MAHQYNQIIRVVGKSPFNTVRSLDIRVRMISVPPPQVSVHIYSILTITKPDLVYPLKAEHNAGSSVNGVMLTSILIDFKCGRRRSNDIVVNQLQPRQEVGPNVQLYKTQQSRIYSITFIYFNCQLMEQRLRTIISSRVGYFIKTFFFFNKASLQSKTSICLDYYFMIIIYVSCRK